MMKSFCLVSLTVIGSFVFANCTYKAGYFKRDPILDGEPEHKRDKGKSRESNSKVKNIKAPSDGSNSKTLPQSPSPAGGKTSGKSGVQSRADGKGIAPPGERKLSTAVGNSSEKMKKYREYVKKFRHCKKRAKSIKKELVGLKQKLKKSPEQALKEQFAKKKKAYLRYKDCAWKYYREAKKLRKELGL